MNNLETRMRKRCFSYEKTILAMVEKNIEKQKDYVNMVKMENLFNKLLMK